MNKFIKWLRSNHISAVLFPWFMAVAMLAVGMYVEIFYVWKL